MLSLSSACRRLETAVKALQTEVTWLRADGEATAVAAAGLADQFAALREEHDDAMEQLQRLRAESPDPATGRPPEDCTDSVSVPWSDSLSLVVAIPPHAHSSPTARPHDYSAKWRAEFDTHTAIWQESAIE